MNCPAADLRGNKALIPATLKQVEATRFGNDKRNKEKIYAFK